MRLFCAVPAVFARQSNFPKIEPTLMVHRRPSAGSNQRKVPRPPQGHRNARPAKCSIWPRRKEAASPWPGVPPKNRAGPLIARELFPGPEQFFYFCSFRRPNEPLSSTAAGEDWGTCDSSFVSTIVPRIFDFFQTRFTRSLVAEFFFFVQ